MLGFSSFLAGLITKTWGEIQTEAYTRNSSTKRRSGEIWEVGLIKELNFYTLDILKTRSTLVHEVLKERKPKHRKDKQRDHV